MSDSTSPNGYDYAQKTACLDHLEVVERMGRDSIGDAHPNAATLARRLAVNPDVLQVFTRCRSERLEVCGFSLLYPVTDKMGTAIVEGRTRSARNLHPENLLTGFEDAKYLYIGMLLSAPDHAARSHAKICLRNELMRRLAHGSVQSVFARPATSSGLRLLGSSGFLPIAGEDGIWAVSSTQLEEGLT